MWSLWADVEREMEINGSLLMNQGVRVYFRRTSSFKCAVREEMERFFRGLSCS